MNRITKLLFVAALLLSLAGSAAQASADTGIQGAGVTSVTWEGVTWEGVTWE